MNNFYLKFSCWTGALTSSVVSSIVWYAATYKEGFRVDSVTAWFPDPVTVILPFLCNAAPHVCAELPFDVKAKQLNFALILE